MLIKNQKELLSHGNRWGREVALDVIEHSIRAVDAYELTKQIVRIKNDKLIVGELAYNLLKLGNIFVIGGGKATFAIARALDEILGSRITGGIINIKRGENRRLDHIKVIEAGHPIPDEAGLEGTKEMLEVAKRAKEGDLVFCVITGGASALMPLPFGEISLKDKKDVTELLLNCGATIDEINPVRKHISLIKGGRLATYIHPAEVINLIIIDEIAGRPWGPTVPDVSTFEDAINVLRKYRLWEKVPNSVRGHLERGLVDSRLETPKWNDFKGINVHNIVLADNGIMCEAAKKRAEVLGYKPFILSTSLEGESRVVGIILASIAKEIETQNRPFRPPCILISGGETTVTITGQHGKGGPSQELVLGASLKLAGSERIVIASLDTDGTDGPTDVAGGIVDGYTLKRAKESGIDVFENLMGHDASRVLMTLHDAIFTGSTGTNVMDLNIVVIASQH
ncbi:MAG: glycerate kinase [Candidatus Heimdallarchaeota archaeon]